MVCATTNSELKNQLDIYSLDFWKLEMWICMNKYFFKLPWWKAHVFMCFCCQRAELMWCTLLDICLFSAWKRRKRLHWITFHTGRKQHHMIVVHIHFRCFAFWCSSSFTPLDVTNLQWSVLHDWRKARINFGAGGKCLVSVNRCDHYHMNAYREQNVNNLSFFLWKKDISGSR